MSNLDSARLSSLLLDPTATKVLATLDQDSNITLVPVPELHLDAQGRLVHLELTEHSRTNADLVRALWFSRRISLLLSESDGRSFQLRGEPHAAKVAGPLFEEWYRTVKSRQDGSSLSTVWLLEIDEILEQTPSVRHARDEEGRIPLVHLDQIARNVPSVEVTA